MSSVVSQRPLTVAQRTAEAARQAGELLAVDDQKRVTAALSEAALDGMRRNSAFVEHVRKLYDDMAPKRAPVARRSATGRAAPGVELVPRKRVVGHDPDPAAPPDPYFLLELYEADQLPLALQRYTVARLREAVKLVKARNPGTKPKGASGQALIDYIVEYVAGA